MNTHHRYLSFASKNDGAATIKSTTAFHHSLINYPKSSTQVVRIEWARYFVCEKILIAHAQFDRQLNCWHNDVSARRRKNAKYEVQRILFSISGYLKALNLETLANTVTLVQRICESASDSPDKEQYQRLKRIIPNLLLFLQHKGEHLYASQLFDIASAQCWRNVYPQLEVENSLALVE